MTDSLLIVGAGGHGKVVADAALQQGSWDKVAFLDDAYPATDTAVGLAVLGKTGMAEWLLSDYSDAVVAIGNSGLRLEWLDRLSHFGYRLPVVQHPRATVSPHARVQAGSVIFAQAVINPDARLDRGCIINTAASVDHDCILGAGVHVAPGAHIAGGVQVGQETWIGIGACVREYIVIGRHVMVGAGAAVVSDVPDGQTVAGVPAVPSLQSKQ